ncbi:cytochrome c biogenesis protein [Phycisphaerales bacterium AB-hyl4]|uniref:Cytochrome c biogenesis protein n=1 Tax=Natronomicrosphaera hydrolytica TaxID=3242702 RepID=A0ABV4U454_9BACT
MTHLNRILPWAVVFLALLYLGMQGRPVAYVGDYDLDAFGAIPVSADGRVKPMDTVARTNLMFLSGRQSFEVDGQQQPAIRWLADVMGQRDTVDHYRVFRIDHPDVQALLHQHEPTTRRFALAEIMPHWEQIVEQSQRAVEVPGRQRDPFQRQVLQLYQQVTVLMEMRHMQTPYMVPPTSEDEEWAPFFRVVQDTQAAGIPHPGVDALTSIFSAYHREQPAEFNDAVASYLAVFDKHMPAEARKASFEVFFNDFTPFYHATLLYVLAFLLAAGSLLMRTRSDSAWAGVLARTALALLVVTFLLHTFGLVSRIYLQGRPPVTNLYSSAVFVGWGTVLLAIIIERFHRLGLATLAAAFVGFVTLIIAHNLAGDGDTMEMMQAVLDSNFWLATHVIIITIGYSATFLAGILATVFIILGVFTPWLNKPLNQSLTKMVYGTICFALLFSFVGTVLGGIWADQSWGRFWGWDPKENGAALIVLNHAIILHARWGGMIQARGMMVLAIAGNIVTAWAWFGTNMLGVGLHSYGFMESAMFWLFAFVLSQLALMGLGMLPPEAWRSAVGRRASTPQTSPPNKP